ncbi:MAG: hypothetical protein VB046_11020 [Paludibacter sp.]|nr:hypothetical protein [Paludibacter sp.]
MENIDINKVFEINNWICYLTTGLLLSLICRLINSSLKAIEVYHDENVHYEKRNYFIILRCIFLGVVKQNSHYSDYWFNFILGTIEILVYPILLKLNAIIIIGAWLGFKTLAQWKIWEDKRLVFNRFLIGNALVVILSYWILRPMINLIE